MYRANLTQPAGPSIPLADVCPTESCSAVQLKSGVHQGTIQTRDKDVKLSAADLQGHIVTGSGHVTTSRGSGVTASTRSEPAIRTDSGSVFLSDTTVIGDIVTQGGDVRMINSCVRGDVRQGGILTTSRFARLPGAGLSGLAFITESTVMGTLQCGDLKVRASNIDCIELDGAAAVLKGDEPRLLIVYASQIGAIHATGPALVVVCTPSQHRLQITGDDVVVMHMFHRGGHEAATTGYKFPTIDAPLDAVHWRQFQHALFALCDVDGWVPGVDQDSRCLNTLKLAHGMKKLLAAWTSRDVKGLIERLTSVVREDDLVHNLAAVGLMLLDSPEASREIDLLITACVRLFHERQLTRGLIKASLTPLEGGEPYGGEVIQLGVLPEFEALALNGTGSHRPIQTVTSRWPEDQLPPVFGRFWSAIGPH